MMLRGIPVLERYANLHLHESDNLKDITGYKNILKGYKKEKHESK